MVKRMLLTFILASGCSTGTVNVPAEHALPFKGTPDSSRQPRLVWKQTIEGKLTDLAIASESAHTLVTQVLEDRTPGNLLSLRDGDGKLLWSTILPSPVRSQAISSSGDWIVIGTYEDEIIRINPKNGSQIWRVEDAGMCRPMILEKSEQVLCFHDDDAIPGAAFTVFDSKGQKKLRFKVPADPLLLKVPRDESAILIGMVKGRLWILDPQFNKTAERQLEGEIVDLATVPASGMQWAALINVHGVGQKLVGMDASGKLKWEQSLELPHQQLELSEDGGSVAVYGNGPRGQYVSFWSPGTRGNWISRWSYHSPRYADYNQRIDMAGLQTILGFEEVTSKTRHSHVVALGPDGNLNWDIPFLSEDGAYLYARGISSKPGLMVVGTDDGELSAFRIPSAR